MKVYFRTLRTKESFYIEENNDIKIKNLKENLYEKKKYIWGEISIFW